MYICYATVFNIILSYVCERPGIQKLFEAIWPIVLQKERSIKDDENSYKYHRGLDIPNWVKKEARNLPIKSISNGIHTNLLPILNESKITEIIKAINILLEHDEIIDNDKVFCENPRYTKKEILDKKAWEIEEYLAIVLKYVFTNDNELDKDLVNTRYKFALSKINKYPSIDIIPFGSSVELPIAIETSKKRFDETFKEIIQSSSLDLARDNHLKLFIVNIVNNKFEYMNLKNLYKYYLSNYVFSKNEKSKYDDPELIQAILFDAIAKTKRTSSFKESALGNLLLYTFLEQVLNAPKLFNSITLSSSNAKSQAVHMLNVDGKHTKLIFGTSEILSDMTAAITNAFNKIKNIELNLTKERNMLIDFNLLNCEFDTKTADLIKDIVIPTKSSAIDTENAFSIFIGYTLKDVDKSLDNENYLLELHKKLIAEIEEASSFIKKKIDELDLYGYSFYIYFVPFNDADHDKYTIVEVL